LTSIYPEKENKKHIQKAIKMQAEILQKERQKKINYPADNKKMIKNTFIISMKFNYKGIYGNLTADKNPRTPAFPHSHLVGWSGGLKSQTSRPPY
jgi:hypothetical protein